MASISGACWSIAFVDWLLAISSLKTRVVITALRRSARRVSVHRDAIGMKLADQGVASLDRLLLLSKPHVSHRNLPICVSQRRRSGLVGSILVPRRHRPERVGRSQSGCHISLGSER